MGFCSKGDNREQKLIVVEDGVNGGELAEDGSVEETIAAQVWTLYIADWKRH